MTKVHILHETIIQWSHKIRVYFALLTLLFIFASHLSARPLKGKVVDADGNPLIGATIRVNNSKEGTVADAYGNFNLHLKSNKLPVILTINYLGYQKQEVKIVNAKSDLGTIKLYEDGYSLNDVVVVGYGKQSRKKLTGAVSKVKGEVISEATQDAPILALQGNASGVYVKQASGVPGGGSTSMVIRGVSTLASNTDPLYIVDGVPLNSTPENPIAYTSTGLLGLPDEMSLINPNDIESIEILKDADATAIYGTRGSNGVVLITTKKGREGRVKVNLKMSTTAQFMSKRLDFLNTEEYIALRKKAFEVDKAKGYVTDADMTPAKFPDLTVWDQHTTYDWQEIMFGNTACGSFYCFKLQIFKGSSCQFLQDVNASFETYLSAVKADVVIGSKSPFEIRKELMVQSSSLILIGDPLLGLDIRLAVDLDHPLLAEFHVGANKGIQNIVIFPQDIIGASSDYYAGLARICDLSYELALLGPDIIVGRHAVHHARHHGAAIKTVGEDGLAGRSLSLFGNELFGEPRLFRYGFDYLFVVIIVV